MHAKFPPFDLNDHSAVKTRLLESLPPAHRQALEIVLDQAGSEVYLVGGIVRDFLLGRPNFDLDFVCLIPAATVAQLVLPAFADAHLIEHEQFGTARLDIDPDLHLDFATARQEIYNQPAVLPTVALPATLEQDLGRRDFTFNAMTLGADGQFYDPFNGLTDLRDGLLRVLHPLSFVDDPTRMVRGVRFAARMGYHFEPETERLLKESLTDGYFNLLSAERRRNELRLILKEQLPQRALTMLDDYGLLSAIQSALPWNAELRRVFNNLSVQSNLDWNEWLAALLHRSGAQTADQVTKALRFDREESLLPVEVARLWEAVRPVLAASISPEAELKNSQLSDLLHSYQLKSLELFYLLDFSTGWKVRRYLDEVVGRKPILTGDDLLRLGLPPGPRLKVLLNRLRAAVLDNEVSGRDQEEAFIKTLLAEGEA